MAATSSAAMGWNKPGESLTVFSFAPSSAMPRRNSRNCVERMMVGMPEASISLSWATYGAEIAILRRPVGSDDGERDMVPDAGSGLRSEKVAAGGLEEFQHRLGLK